MSFLGNIGPLMAGSELKGLLEIIYVNNAGSHFLIGKAIARAIRAHLLVDTALSVIIVPKTFNVPLPLRPAQESVLP